SWARVAVVQAWSTKLELIATPGRARAGSRPRPRDRRRKPCAWAWDARTERAAPDRSASPCRTRRDAPGLRLRARARRGPRPATRVGAAPCRTTDPAQLHTELLVAHAALHDACHLVVVEGRERRRRPLQDLGDRRHVGRDRRTAAECRLEHGEPEPLVERRE